jgi:hypothetical protein
MINELTNSLASTNSETKQESKSENTITEKSKEELELIKNQDIIISNLIEGRTLSECIKDKNLNPSQISLMKFYAILKKNTELESKILEARKIGVQTLIDKLMQIFQYQEIENPNAILWIREKTKFVIYVAGHLTDLYSNNKIQNLKSDTSIKISWEDNSSDLIDVSGDTIDVPPNSKD